MSDTNLGCITTVPFVIYTHTKKNGTVANHYSVNIDTSGKSIILDANGVPVTSRKIKSTVEYATAYKEAEQNYRDYNINYANEINDANASKINVHLLAKKVMPFEQLQAKLDKLKPEKYIRNIYTGENVTDERVVSELKTEAAKNVFSWKIWQIPQLRKQYVLDNFARVREDYDSIFKSSVELFEENENTKELNENAKFLDEYEKTKKRILNQLSDDISVIEKQVSDLFIKLKNESAYKIDGVLAKEGKVASVISLPSIESLPQSEIVLLESGAAKEKKKTQAALRNDYANHIFSLALYAASSIFNSSTKIKEAVISGFTNVKDSDGNSQSNYLYSIRFPREALEQVDISSIEKPMDFCMQFENRCKPSSTLQFKAITPLDEEQIDQSILSHVKDYVAPVKNIFKQNPFSRTSVNEIENEDMK